MKGKIKKHNTIGCCGIDCGLCPRFHTRGSSVCPGCGGLDFRLKHPSCGFLTCCVEKHGLEVCSGCGDYPCARFDPELKGFDSFVTHKKVFSNLGNIKSNGLDSFIELQRIRMEILSDFLTCYDDGRSKSFFCVSCALLPWEELQETNQNMKKLSGLMEAKDKNKLLRNSLRKIAESRNIELKLNNTVRE